MRAYHTTAVLEKAAKTGNTVFWQGEAVSDGTRYYRRTRTWQLLSGGRTSQVVESEPAEATPKNVGRANETSARDQAVFEINALAVKKQQEGYRVQGAKAEIIERPLPMLAHEFTKHGHKLNWFHGVYVQPKLDGMRALCRNGQFWSRKGLPLIPEVTQHIQFDTDLVLDGELILNREYVGSQLDKDVFQQTMSAAKRFSPASKHLEYWVFDIVGEGTFEERTRQLQQAVAAAPVLHGIRLVPTIKVSSKAEVDQFLRNALEEGFEGAILRSPSNRYEIGHRSYGLLKYKVFVDAEFRIVDVHEGVGGDAGAAIFECALPNGDTFRVRPRGTIESRQAMWRNRAHYVGKQLTVIYQNLSEAGVPRFPVGKAIRED